MASFFQPAVYDPDAPTISQSSAEAPGRFLIYTNSTLIGQGIFGNWYQFVVLAIGAASITVPVIKWLLGGAWKRLGRRRRSKYAKLETQNDTIEDEVSPVSNLETRALSAGIGSPITSFGLFLRGCVDDFLATPHDLHIVDYETCCKGLPGLRKFSTTAAQDMQRESYYQSHPDRNIWALVDDSNWRTITSAHATTTPMVDRLKLVTRSQRLSGLIFATTIKPISKLKDVIASLVESGVPCMLLDSATEPLLSIEPNLVCGIIYKNACILSNGSRRDFFQASKLRSSMARYGPEVKRQTNFFIGFLDLWANAPLPSVIRRSYKFAKFHGAVMHHEAAGGVHYQSHDTSNWGNASSAFDWLKRSDIVEIQRAWISTLKPMRNRQDNSSLNSTLDLSEVDQIIPGVRNAFALQLFTDQNYDSQQIDSEYYECPSYVDKAPPRDKFWTTSSQGKALCEQGCFDIREELFEEHYSAILTSQKHLLRLGMLEDLTETDLRHICSTISRSSLSSSIPRGLLTNLSAGLLSRQIKIFRGLDSGFCLPESRGHFWAVSDVDDDGNLNIFVSLKTPDLVTTVVHTYLAHRGISRRARFDIELSLISDENQEPLLHPRIVYELENATYSELLHMLEQITVARVEDPILEKIAITCEKILLDETTNRAWTEMHSHEFLAKRILPTDLFRTRLDYFAKRGSRYLPQLDRLVIAFKQIDDAIRFALYESSEERLEILSRPIWKMVNGGRINFDDCSDLYALMFFCSLRRLAFEEVFMETTDRCPLFLQQKDQAAVFAELWVLGSQCESYFGIRPRAVGAIIYEEYRDYLHANPPTPESWNGTDVFTAYHKVKTEDLDKQILIGSDIKTNATAAVPFRARLAKASFLTIFCIPAIIDVGLLTFLGRGLYLTAFMTLEERVMANYAVLSALMMTAGITGWSGSSGGFYLYQSAFHNMNHFMVQRLSGGFMITCLLAVCAFIVFGFEYSWYGAFIFVAYLMVLSTYLNLLGIMATMHRDGAPFKSGRTVLAQSLLITLISPIVSSFVNGHDVLIYLLVLYLFLAVLIINYSKLCREWSDWPEKIPIVKEAEILKWYQAREETVDEDDEKDGLLGGSSLEAKAGMLTKATSKLTKLLKSGQKLTEADEFFRKLAIGHPYVVWLLEKESNGQPLPPPYTSTWLVQTKLALTNQQQLNRGLKEHSPFLLFRNAKYDLAQNVGLFLIALLDRWVAVSMSANGLVVNVYYNNRARYGIAFGLLYFLLCAVSLDVVLQRYWGKTGRRSSEKLGNIFDFEATEAAETAVEKRRWFVAIMELVWVMTCIFGLMTILLWLFVSDGNQIILYLAYIVGYSAVIIFQFNRVFTTDIRIHVRIVFLAAFGGYIVGVVLHEIPATKAFRFSDVIALCSASISAAIGTWLYTDFCDDPSQEIHIENEDMVNWKVYSQKLIGESVSHCTLHAEQLANLQGIECRFEDQSTLSEGIKAIFAKALVKRDAPIHETFARAQEMLEYTLRLWKHDQMRLLVVDRKNLTEAGGSSVFAASTLIEGTLRVYIGMPSMSAWNNISSESYETLLIQLASEAMMHECCEAMMHLRHCDATLAELLLNGTSNISTRMAVQLAWADQTELASIALKTTTELLRHLCLGVNADTSWEQTPEDVRLAIISRIVGRAYVNSETLREWLLLRSDSIKLHDWYLKQSLGIREVALSRLTSQTVADGTESSWSVKERVWNNTPLSYKNSGAKSVRNVFIFVYQSLFTFIQFVAIISTAGTDCGRELWYILRGTKLSTPILWILLKVWKVCWWSKTLFTRMIILHWDIKYRQFQEWTVKGASRTLGKGILVISDPRYQRTGFVASAMNGVELAIYDGSYKDLPVKQNHRIASYSSSMRLTRISWYQAGQIHEYENHYYEYSTSDRKRRYPISRTIHIDHEDYPAYYDSQGRLTHGECSKHGARYRFLYVYSNKVRDSRKILRVTYTSVGLLPVTFDVYWCRASENSSADVQSWTPTARVAKIVKTTSTQVQEMSFTYEHKRDPVILRTLWSRTGQQLREPEVVEKYVDELGITELPQSIAFEDEDLLFYHSKHAIQHAGATSPRARRPSTMTAAHKLSIWSRFSGKKKHISRQLISTADLRSSLWKQWAARTDMNAVTTCLLDEMMLRHEPSLKKYWSCRDAGHFLQAKQYLSDNLEDIVAAIELSNDASAKMSLAIRPSDLFVMGLSKDSNFVTTQPEETYIDTNNRVAVIFTDTGCWPDAPGGVSNCRRDLVDGHTTIRNYALTESANEYGIPRFQVEKNLQLVKNLPLWGLDGKSPCHGLFDNLLQTQVEERIRRTRTKEDIEHTFIPLLTAIVRGARMKTFSSKDLSDFTKVFLNLNRYFEENDYLKTWRSKSVRKAWREAWLTEYADENISNPNDSFQIERPTASDFDEALELYVSYFFVFSVRVPEKVPRVYQSTHHGISSLYGMILKIRKGTTWGIWDHAIMWRESCLNISPAQCILPIAVQSMLLGAMKLAANLAYTHADVILPCTAIYNPIWEAELGTDQGRRGSQKLFQRKIDPITNGISNMDKFKPVEEIRSKEPTVIMLSNVQFIKDVKNAILAAGVIINDFGFKKYNLVVYGAQDRQPSYAIETEEMINNMNIQSTVKLGGFGLPNEVLKDAWLFMNSSLSEGLPLAIGEAALSGIPIVATEVGATAQVLTDADDPSILYGEVVPPNDPVALARAQLSLLAMLGPWAKYTKDDTAPPTLPTRFTPHDVEWITKRMYDKTADRKALGLRLREVVLRKFNGNRYLREHEQMFWIQRQLADRRADGRLSYLAASHPRFGQPIGSKLIEIQDPETMWLEDRWQNFSKSGEKRTKKKVRRVKKGVTDSLDAEERMLGNGDEQ